MARGRHLVQECRSLAFIVPSLWSSVAFYGGNDQLCQQSRYLVSPVVCFLGRRAPKVVAVPRKRLRKLSVTQLQSISRDSAIGAGIESLGRWQLAQVFASLIRTHTKEVVFSGLCTLMSSSSLLWLIRLFGRLSSAVAAGSLANVGQLAVGCSVALLLRVASQFGQDVWLSRTCNFVEDALRARYVASALDFGLEEGALDSGEASMQATMEIERVGSAMLLVLRSLAPSVLQFVVMLAYMLYVSLPLTLCILCTAPLMAVVYAILERRLDQYVRQAQKLFARYAAATADSFRNRQLLQLYLAQDFAASKLEAFAKELLLAKNRMHFIRAGIVPAISVCYAITVLTMLYASALCISWGYLEPKELVSFIAAVAFLIEPVQGIASGLGNVKEGEESARRVFRVINLRPKKRTQIETSSIPKPAASKIQVRNVWFRYAPDSEYVLRGVTMTVHPGERVAIVGGSGAGKSTLIAVLSRMCDPQRGFVYLDGVDIRSMPLDYVRRQVCVVPQDAPMLNFSVAENVAFGLPMDPKKVEYCCQLAKAHDFIVKDLPAGYETLVGEGGSNLSGGQRQRLAIARALYREPGVLILDEAYSALDAENETHILSSLRELFASSAYPRTTIFIAHRLSSVRDADRIAVMENGEIVEYGTHEELLRESNSRYGMLLALQERNH
jgi:ABC-type multidrug transport system fused ATPase/permease subunit